MGALWGSSDEPHRVPPWAEGPTAPGGRPVPVCPGPTDHRLPARREFRHKSNITFNDNDTVSFLEYRSFQFQPDKSHGLESDYIVMPNILVLVRLPLAAPLVPALTLRLRASVSLVLPAPCVGRPAVGGTGGSRQLMGPDSQPIEFPRCILLSLLWGYRPKFLSFPS